jgi:hypothetical protein
MIFGQWMNSDNEIDYLSDYVMVTVNGAVQNNEWRLLAATARKRTFSIQSKDSKFSADIPNLIYSFIIERHSSLIIKAIGGEFELPSISFAQFSDSPQLLA